MSQSNVSAEAVQQMVRDAIARTCDCSTHRKAREDRVDRLFTALAALKAMRKGLETLDPEIEMEVALVASPTLTYVITQAYRACDDALGEDATHVLPREDYLPWVARMMDLLLSELM